MPIAPLTIPFDTEILFYLNGSHTPFLDKLMWTITSPWSWIPIYIAFIGLLFYLFRKKAWRVLIIVIFGLMASDVVSSRIIKPSVKRIRPTHDAELLPQLHIHQKENGSYYYGGSYSFVSGHASNNTVIATLIFYFIAPFYKRKKSLFCVLLCYVLSIGLSRIYLGVHYPTDILCGVLTGLFVAMFCIWIDKKWSWDINRVRRPIGFYPMSGCSKVIWP